MPLVQQQTQLQTPTQPGAVPPPPITLATPASSAEEIAKALNDAAKQPLPNGTTDTQFPGVNLHQWGIQPGASNAGIQAEASAIPQTMGGSENLNPNITPTTTINPSDQFIFRDPNALPSPADVITTTPQPIQTTTAEISSQTQAPVETTQAKTFVDMASTSTPNPAQAMGITNLGSNVTPSAPATPAPAEVVEAAPQEVPRTESKIIDTSKPPVLDFAAMNKKISTSEDTDPKPSDNQSEDERLKQFAKDMDDLYKNVTDPELRADIKRALDAKLDEIAAKYQLNPSKD